MGDSLLIVDGQLRGSNCDKVGYSVPATLVLDAPSPRILVQTRGAGLPNATKNALAAGPNLVSFANGSAFIDIRANDDNNNIYVCTLHGPCGLVLWTGRNCLQPPVAWASPQEHAANTAVGLQFAADGVTATTLFMVTADGHDGATARDPTSGINAHQFAFFLKDVVGADAAMGMDQGGSTTMWIKGYGVVSNSDTPGGSDPRPLYDGLFVRLNQ